MPASPVMPIPEDVDQSKLVRIWPVLCRLAISAGLGSQLRLWVICHYLNNFHGGRGWVTVGQIVELTGWSPKTVRRLINEGLGIFIHYTTGEGMDRRIRFASQEYVAKQLRECAQTDGLYDPNEKERDAWMVDLEAVISSSLTFYAACFEGWIGTHKGHEYRVSWNVLEAAWGRVRSTLQEWMIAADLSKHQNMGTFEIPSEASYDELLHRFTVSFMIGEYAGRRYVYFYRANTYKTQDHWRKPTSKGRKYKLNRLIDGAGVNGGSPIIADGGASTGHDGSPVVASAGGQSDQGENFERHNFTRLDAFRTAFGRSKDYLYFLEGQSRRFGIWSYETPDRKR